MSHFDSYGRMAEAALAETNQNGRYLAQQEAELLVPADVMSKLNICPEDSFLDIGCGLGLNLLEINKIASKCTACDHPNIINRLKSKYPDLKADFYGENFLEAQIDNRFTKILAYSVLPALPDSKTVYAFVDKALSLLEPNGRMLLGDLANEDKKKRFLTSQRGAQFQKEWEAMREDSGNEQDIASFLSSNDQAVTMNDDLIIDLLRHIRGKGYSAYLLSQPQNLPFGNTREDILVEAPEYRDSK